MGGGEWVDKCVSVRMSMRVSVQARVSEGGSCGVKSNWEGGKEVGV